jgi:broad specificity phosphatase PhoE
MLRMRLLIVRHGETVANTQSIISGHLDTELTPLGRKQATLIGERLKGEKIDLFLSSDLSRAVETASAISQHHSRELITLPSLRERSWGEFEGKPLQEYYKSLKESALPHYKFTPDQGEGLVDLQQRCNQFLLEWLPSMESKTTLIVAHHSMNKMLIVTLLKKTLADWYTFDQGNTCLNILDGDNPSNIEGVLLNCTEHLSRI